VNEAVQAGALRLDSMGQLRKPTLDDMYTESARASRVMQVDPTLHNMCNQGAYEGRCEFRDLDCPALASDGMSKPGKDVS
jgi:hypothetical protein